MIRRAVLLLFLCLLALIWLPAAKAQGDGRVVSEHGTFSSLSEALAQAQDGETIEVHGGIYQGPITVDRSVTLIGQDWPVIDGEGLGTVVKLAAPGIVLRGFVIKNSGVSLDEENAGIAVEAPAALIEDNQLEGTLFGIYLRQAPGSTIRNNIITSKALPVPRRGDAIRIWYSNDVRVEDNVVNQGRDVVLWYSERLLVRGNEISDGRYGLHFMYCDDATIEYNRLTGNSVGTFLMYSRRLHLLNNTIAANRGPSGYGVGLKDMDDAVVRNNLFLDNRVGAYLDNSPREVDSVGHFEGNVFAYNDVGVSLMPSVRHNQFAGNSFVENGEQVSISSGSGRHEDNAWTMDGRGNYWSDYAGYDADGDGLGDLPYRAERLFESLMDEDSSLRLFLYSPVQQALDFAARAMPFVKPQPKLTDTAPLMAPVMPNNLPPLPEQQNRPMWFAALGLLVLGVIILAWARPKKMYAVTKRGRSRHDGLPANIQCSVSHDRSG
ncbi:MAG: nitrous oxide reductase family maturation protein NosD [Candidatus Promineifilaceae bacterium]